MKDLDLSNDFGFTEDFIDEKKTKKKEKVLTIDEYKDRMGKIEDIVLPLLANLHATADNPNIYWPDRKDELEKKIKELLALTRA